MKHRETRPLRRAQESLKVTKVTQFGGFLGAICKLKKFRANRWSTAVGGCESTIRKSALTSSSAKQVKSYFERLIWAAPAVVTLLSVLGGKRTFRCYSSM